MSVAAWDGFLNDQSNWPAASRIGNATGATTARDTLGDKTFVKRKRMSQEERHLQILQAAVKIIATKGFWGMSLQNISDELGITEAALYHYISSKDDLLNMVLSECYDTIDADEYNAVTAAIVDADGHRVYYYPRYCLNIVLYNLQRPELVQLYSVLNGEALNPSHPAHDFFIGRPVSYTHLDVYKRQVRSFSSAAGSSPSNRLASSAKSGSSDAISRAASRSSFTCLYAV